MIWINFDKKLNELPKVALKMTPATPTDDMLFARFELFMTSKKDLRIPSSTECAKN
jgi:hypothetical protein